MEQICGKQPQCAQRVQTWQTLLSEFLQLPCSDADPDDHLHMLWSTTGLMRPVSGAQVSEKILLLDAEAHQLRLSAAQADDRCELLVREKTQLVALADELRADVAAKLALLDDFEDKFNRQYRYTCCQYNMICRQYRYTCVQCNMT